MLSTTGVIVFDLDGTLVDSLPDIARHLNDAVAEHGIEPSALEQIGEWVGHGAAHLVTCAVSRTELVAPVLATFRERYRSRPVIASRVYDGLGPVLDMLASRFRLAVLSNKPHELAVDVVRQLCARWPFEVVAGQRDDRPSKPDPRSLEAIASELRIDVKRCVLVGDSEVDIATARAARTTGIAVSWGLRPLAVLTDARPDYLVHAPAELGALFS